MKKKDAIFGVFFRICKQGEGYGRKKIRPEDLFV